MYRLERSGARFLIADRSTLQSLSPDLPTEIGVIYRDHLLDLLQAAHPDFTQHPTQADDPAILIYTSGTTGKSKGSSCPTVPCWNTSPVFGCSATSPRSKLPTGRRQTGPGLKACSMYCYAHGLMATR